MAGRGYVTTGARTPSPASAAWAADRTGSSSAPADADLALAAQDLELTGGVTHVGGRFVK
jgi:hypothetical protein